LLAQTRISSVFRAVQINTGQLVALKLLRHLSEHNNARQKRLSERFQREIDLCAQLQNSHIVRLVDHGYLDNDSAYAVFEYLPGQTLRKLIRYRGALDLQTTVDLLGQVLDAIIYIHSRGIAHRDLKPTNIMVMRTRVNPQIKVLDFGISILVEASRKRPVESMREVLGTPSYSAPEQLRGELPTLKSDLYSWGLLFIECLTGRAAVRGATIAEIIHKQLDPIDVSLPPNLVGSPLGNLLRKVLRKNPSARIRSAACLYVDFHKLGLGNNSIRPFESMSDQAAHDFPDHNWTITRTWDPDSL
jgi:serine/threonine protein kinase